MDRYVFDISLRWSRQHSVYNKKKFFRQPGKALPIEINFWLLINNKVKFNSDQNYDSDRVFIKLVVLLSNVKQYNLGHQMIINLNSSQIKMFRWAMWHWSQCVLIVLRVQWCLAFSNKDHALGNLKSLHTFYDYYRTGV